ncbi:hypothetical protein C0Q70_02651 [Pomacea canaliculata]|uniref:Contactin n=1 Tax=Pomacea canaliculata TaxID=400727 RepID=A0A2T7PQJ7_POMCA|nr:hypothetical protein C0Q70_02651 [Pomacea canaliculata]
MSYKSPAPSGDSQSRIKSTSQLSSDEQMCFFVSPQESALRQVGNTCIWHMVAGFSLPSDCALCNPPPVNMCSEHGGSLVSVLDRITHGFISSWLERNDPFMREWYTSGIREKGSTREKRWFVWEGHGGDPLSGAESFWNPGTNRNSSNGVIVYSLGEGGYGWTLVTPDRELPYICQVARAEAYRILQVHRDYDYGLMVQDINVLPRGPHFTRQPVSIVIVGGPTMAELECLAVANPVPSYRWYRGDNFEDEVTAGVDSRYTLTNGKLIIQNPVERLDANQYRCTAQNHLGVVMSNDVRISFGDLGEFSNVPDAGVNSKAYDGVAIECSRITFKPAVKYNWFKESAYSFVRPEYQTYQFISQNGKLYFSEVTRADEGRYHCIAILTGVNRYTIGTSQPPTRTSLGIQLHVHDQAPKADWGPLIQDDFIAVFPQPPLKGHDVRMECFAYGSSTSPFLYQWHREEKPMPARAELSDQNRVLTLIDAQLEDQGTYVCTVSRGSNAKDSKSFYLVLGARPYFISPLRDQHADLYSQLTWRCDARGRPPPTYTWFKDGKALTSDPAQGIQINANVMRISNLDPKVHDGMYQCGARNVHGMTLSEAQLRILAFPPTFKKQPLKPRTMCALNSNITITCKPEAAPAPTITWLKNDSPLDVDNNHVTQLPNGNLLIRNVQHVDQGRYTCVATNQFDEARSSTTVTIAAGTSIVVAPSPTQVMVNHTAFMACSASHAPHVDLVYTWYVNGHRVDTEKKVEYRQTDTGLYVVAVQLQHAGFYECVARTTMDEDRRGAWLSVIGPPSEPSGCFVDGMSVKKDSVDVLWTPSTDNGRPISLYVVQLANSFDENVWQTVFSDSPSRISIEPDTQKLRVKVHNLYPGNGYRFRILAVNELGYSVPSLPSTWVYLPSAPPSIPPRDIRGGGGGVGDLLISWMPLEPWEENGHGIGYKIYWRRYGDPNSLWRKAEVEGFNDHYVAFVGGENYFLEYEVKVQAFNRMGSGPNSSVVVVFSAEDLPALSPTEVRGEGYNGSANLVTWVPIPATREAARGVILGYQINYWLEGTSATDYRDFIRYEGHVTEGIYMGLASDTFYFCEVRAFNSAGLGPPSDTYMIESTLAPASEYPEEVRVYSAEHDQVLVWWRGIHITQPEANIHGFVIYFWPANEHYRSRCEAVIHDHHAHEAHLTVDKGIIYALRVSAFSKGGYGRKSPTMYFSTEGEVTIDRAFAKEIDVFLSLAFLPAPSRLLLWACLLAVTGLVTSRS